MRVWLTACAAYGSRVGVEKYGGILPRGHAGVSMPAEGGRFAWTDSRVCPRDSSEIAALLLPEGATVQSAYGSLSYEEDTASLALVVAPPSLIALEVRFGGQWPDRPEIIEVKREIVPIKSIVRITTNFVVLRQSDAPAQLRETRGVEGVKISFSQELPPFGREITLPLSKGDYDGSHHESARQAAHRVSESLARLGIGA